MTGAKRVAVIGGGAAGMMAAGYLGELGALVTLYERNRKTGAKLLITGKGRCNVTNASDIPTFINNVMRNPRFLYTALSRFGSEDTMSFFEDRGVPLKVERGNRVFPESDQSADIVMALRRYLEASGVKTVFARVQNIVKTGVGFLVETSERSVPFDAVIIATGGKSYPKTGSTGDGYRFAETLGHTVTPLFASLVPLECEEGICRALQGLSLRNVAVSALDENGKVVFDDFGELLFTHFGISGPTVLSMSAHLRDIGKKKYKVSIDLKPALDEATLDKRLLSDFSKYPNRNFDNALGDLLPKKLIEPFVRLVGIPPYKKVNEITKEERRRMISILKHFTLTVRRTRPLDEAIVTAGGVDVREVNPKTMESKLVPGLFFAGEVLDVDAYTGGFNLQIAFSTARLAAEGALDIIW